MKQATGGSILEERPTLEDEPEMDNEFDSEQENDPISSNQITNPSSLNLTVFEERINCWLDLQLPIKKMLELSQSDEEHPYTGKRTAFYNYVRKIRRQRVTLAGETTASHLTAVDDIFRVNWRELDDATLANPVPIIENRFFFKREAESEEATGDKVIVSPLPKLAAVEEPLPEPALAVEEPPAEPTVEMSQTIVEAQSEPSEEAQLLPVPESVTEMNNQEVEPSQPQTATVEAEPSHAAQVELVKQLAPTELSASEVAIVTVEPETTEPKLVPDKDKKGKSKKKGQAAQASSIFDRAGLDERFQKISQQLGLAPTREQPLLLGITSSVRGEGRSTVALGMSLTLSQQLPIPVILVETDLERPALAQDLGLKSRGLSEYLRGEMELDDLMQSTAQPDLMVIVAGDCQGQALRTLRSSRLNTLLETLKRHFAVIVVDLPPLSQTGESSRVIGQLDQVLMVVEAGNTPSRVVKDSLELIPEEKVMGVVLNRTRPSFGLLHRIKRLFR